MRKWLKRIVLGVLGLAVLAVLTGVTYERWSRWEVGRTLSPPGEMVEVDGHRMHIHCLGEGTPTVILEAGWGSDGSMSWDPVIDDIASVTRVCAYDRPGILWSDPGPATPSADRLTGDLHTLLGTAGEAPPYVVVGHSMGGPLMIVYADRYPDEVVGMVLVDSSHPEQNDRYPAEAMEIERSMMPPPLMFRALASTGLLRWRMARRGGDTGEGSPDPMAARLPQSVSGMMAEMETMDSIFGEADRVSTLGDIPMVVLSAGAMFKEAPVPEITEDLLHEMDSVHAVLQQDLATLSSNAELRVVEDATHYIHHDRPDVVIATVTEVVETARSAG